MKRLTDDEVLAELERMIELLRSFRSQPTTPEHLSWLTLRAAAADLRARQAVVIGLTRSELEPAIERMYASRTGLGYDMNRMHAVAQTVAAHWRTIKQALVLFSEAKDQATGQNL